MRKTDIDSKCRGKVEKKGIKHASGLVGHVYVDGLKLANFIEALQYPRKDL